MICKISFINKHGYPEHCVEEAAFADYNEKIANEEKWAKTLCRRHYILAKAKTSGAWVSYPEHATVTIPKENTVPETKTISIKLVTPEEFSGLFSAADMVGLVDFYTYDRKIIKREKTGEYFIFSPDGQNL